MSDSGSQKPKGRNLPSWMSSRSSDDKPSDEKDKRHVGQASKSNKPSDEKDKPHVGQASKSNKPSDEKDKRHVGQASKSNKPSDEKDKPHVGQASKSNKSSKPMEGVVFALSGFINPERGTLRSQALEMGAEYQADWNSKCTLLVCAFSNTPKFRQVEAENGTIVSKDWITECYNQKKLVGIEPYLLHAGKPWKHQSNSTGPSQDPQVSSSKNSKKQADKPAESKPRASSSSKTAHKPAKKEFSTSEVKKWAIDDMNKTISWLDSQEEKPDPSEMKKIAAEGILTCLQDAIDSLKNGEGLGKIIEEWSFVPRVVEELNKLDTTEESPNSTSKKDIYHQAIVCQRIYEFEVGNLKDDTSDKNKRPKIEKGKETKNYDSDDTIEMTEDEVKEAFDSVASSIVK